jgi:hypothetical protein
MVRASRGDTRHKPIILTFRTGRHTFGLLRNVGIVVDGAFMASYGLGIVQINLGMDLVLP